MGLHQDFLIWEEKLAALLEEGRELGVRMAQLERQNRQLQESHVQASYNSGGGALALHGLYDEGFHVCHAHFAEARDEDCLFCLSLLHHAAKEDGQEIV